MQNRSSPSPRSRLIIALVAGSLIVLTDTGCPVAEPVEPLPRVGFEILMPSAPESEVSVDCLLRVAELPYITIEMELSNRSAEDIVVSQFGTRMHVARNDGDVLVFHGPSPSPSRAEVHLLLRDPSLFEIVPSHSTRTFRSWLELVPGGSGVRLEPGDFELLEYAPLSCAVSYWPEDAWSPTDIEVRHIAISGAIDFHGYLSKPHTPYAAPPHVP